MVLKRQHPLHITREHVDLQIDTAARAQMLQCGVDKGMRNQVDGNEACAGRIVHLVDGQADTLHRDRTLVGQKRRQLRRSLDLQQVAFALFGKNTHRTNPIDMAANHMASQPVAGAQGFFQVDGAWNIQPGCARQGFSRNIHGEGIRGAIQRGNGHAGAIKGDTVTGLYVAQILRRGGNLQLLAMRRTVAQRMNAGDLTNSSDDAGKHTVFAKSRRFPALYRKGGLPMPMP